MLEQSVVNASPLIFLSKAGMLHLLQQESSEVLVPESVAQEILKRGSHDVTAKALESTSWLTTIEVVEIPALIQSWDLGTGESSILAYAYLNSGVTAIIDDGPGRYCAETLGIPLRGTLGLVMMAKKREIIPAARPVVALLKEHGMFLSESDTKVGQTPFLPIDVNMVRAGSVKHPRHWKHGGYNEIVKPKHRYRLIDHASLRSLTGFDDNASLTAHYKLDQQHAQKRQSLTRRYLDQRCSGWR